MENNDKIPVFPLITIKLQETYQEIKEILDLANRGS